MMPFRYQFDGCQKILEVGSSTTSQREMFPGIEYTTLDKDPDCRPDVVADAHSLPFPDNSFDGVICLRVLRYFHSPHLFISEVYRVLKPGGKFVVSAPCVHPYMGACDYYRFTEEGLRFLLREFRIDEVTSTGGLLFALGYFFKPLKGILQFADRFYTSGNTKHSYAVLCTKE